MVSGSRLLVTLVAALASTLAIAQGNTCTNCTSIAAPWSLKGTVYSVLLLLPDGTFTGELPVKAFPPLERQYPSALEGAYKGIIGLLQVIRYTQSPIGPYDELLLVPGFFAYNRTSTHGTVEEKQGVRVTRMYVNSSNALYNGRQNWNIPKHLARFDWTEDTSGTTVKIYPHDTTGDPTESSGAASKPWFQMSYRSTLVNNLLDLVNVPFSTDLFSLIGANATLIQPPLPRGNDSQGLLVATSGWKATVPRQSSIQTSLVTFDLAQGAGDAGVNRSNAVGDEYFPNFWPGLGRYNLGYKMDNADITFGDPELWAQ